MNSKLLIFISFLVAILGHFFFFHFSTVTFTIDQEAPKPKLFFLGPVLKQSEVFHQPIKQVPEENTVIAGASDSIPINFKDMNKAGSQQDKNPFTINTIKKPLLPKTDKEQDKPLLKSTFENAPAAEHLDQTKEHITDIELNIQPYQPLRSQRHPSNLQ